jgi:hypothetical protein
VLTVAPVQGRRKFIPSLRDFGIDAMKDSSLVWLGCIVLGCAVVAGCGPTDLTTKPTVDVNGTVTLDGSPMPEGEVFLVSVADNVREVFPVKDGKFSGKASEGSRKVEVRSYKQAAASKEASDMYGSAAEGSKENFIPAKFNTETTLSADVKAGAPLEFAVTSQ